MWPCHDLGKHVTAIYVTEPTQGQTCANAVSGQFDSTMECILFNTNTDKLTQALHHTMHNVNSSNVVMIPGLNDSLPPPSLINRNMAPDCVVQKPELNIVSTQEFPNL